MIPLKDDNPRLAFPYVTIALLIANVLVFYLQINYGFESIINRFAAVPARLLHLQDIETAFTSMFLHGGFLHLGGNMLYLWIFADNIEGYLGHIRFLFFYMVCGLAALLAHVVVGGAADVPLVGASGAISGVLGAYMVKYPRARVLVVIPIVFFFSIRYIPAIFVLGFWFLIQVFSGLLATGQGGGGVAFWAHIGGFVAGLLLIKLIPGKKRPASFWT